MKNIAQLRQPVNVSKVGIAAIRSRKRHCLIWGYRARLSYTYLWVRWYDGASFWCRCAYEFASREVLRPAQKAGFSAGTSSNLPLLVQVTGHRKHSHQIQAHQQAFREAGRGHQQLRKGRRPKGTPNSCLYNCSHVAATFNMNLPVRSHWLLRNFMLSIIPGSGPPLPTERLSI